jgi:hypothetical protein
VPDDPGIGHEAFDVGRAVGGDRLGVEATERSTVPVALAEDRRPRQSRLRPLEGQQLEQVDRIAGRHAPLLVVIFDERARVARPPAARASVRARLHAAIVAVELP